jgi:hypothetical protein
MDMNLNFAFTGWDWLLLVAVSLMGTTLAYLHHPKWKALILSLPIPFTLASLSLGRNVDTTNMLGLLFLVIYTNGVRWLYLRLKLPILAAILLSGGAYAVLATSLAPFIPRTEPVFWIATVGVFLSALGLLRLMPHRDEPGHRTPLPVWIKFPLIAGVVLLLVIAKNMLQGFMTMFPMVGLVAAYEARHSLWTICRAIPQFTLWMAPTLAVIHVLQPHLGLGLALVIGWVVYLALLIPFTARHWQRIEMPKE